MSAGHAFIPLLNRLRLCQAKAGEGIVPKFKFKEELLAKAFKHETWSRINEKLITLGDILTKQCNFYASQRLRRALQIWNLYTKLYNERSFHRFVSKMVKELRSDKKKPLGILLGASMFSWEKEKITNEEMHRYAVELDRIERTTDFLKSTKAHQNENQNLTDDGWEAVIKKENIFLWRKSMPGTCLYEYKVFGTFKDISPRAFFQVQKDIEYRKKWDNLVIKLDIIEKDKEEEGNEVVHWVMHYPYPMYSREYVYVRRAYVDQINNAMIVVSRAIDHPSCPATSKYVRVTNYSSRMVIKPHQSFDENGFDYLLTYFDDPQAAFPNFAYSWMASSGVPEFVEKLHSAAKELHRHSWPCSVVSQSPNTCTSSGMQYAYA